MASRPYYVRKKDANIKNVKDPNIDIGIVNKCTKQPQHEQNNTTIINKSTAKWSKIRPKLFPDKVWTFTIELFR